MRDEVLKALEAARNTKLIGTGLEAQVVITASDPAYSRCSDIPLSFDIFSSFLR